MTGGNENFSSIQGTEDADEILVTSGNQVIETGGGDDRIVVDVTQGGGGIEIPPGAAGVAAPIEVALFGGAGNDTYYIDSAGQSVRVHISDSVARGEENRLVLGSGYDHSGIRLGLGSLKMTLPEGQGEIHLENFDPNNVFGPRTIQYFSFADGSTLSYEELVSRGFDIDGTKANDALTGTNTTDRLTGLAGDDSIDGGDGADDLRGGAGNDELRGGEGGDKVKGNSGNDRLWGDAGADWLLGGRGDDVLDGGSENDKLFGGEGNDTYVFGHGSGNDRIRESGGFDTVTLGRGISSDQLWFTRTGSHLNVQLLGTGDTVTVKGWYNDPERHIEQFRTTGGEELAGADVQRLVDAMAAFDPPAAGELNLHDVDQQQIRAVIAATWQAA